MRCELPAARPEFEEPQAARSISLLEQAGDWPGPGRIVLRRPRQDPTVSEFVVKLHARSESLTFRLRRPLRWMPAPAGGTNRRAGSALIPGNGPGTLCQLICDGRKRVGLGVKDRLLRDPGRTRTGLRA
jgi:hypothetical protein